MVVLYFKQRNAANKMFKSVFLPENKLQPHFYQFMHCYDLLSEHAKWKSSLQKTVQGVQTSKGKNKAQRTTDSSSPGDSPGSPDCDEFTPQYDDDFVRPIGTKAAKKKMASQSRVETLIVEGRDQYQMSRVEKKIQHDEKKALQERLLETKMQKHEEMKEMQRRLLQAKEEKTMDAIMMCDTTGMNAQQLQYIQMKRDEIMRKMTGQD